MNASSESGECASLISSAFVTACLVAMVSCPLNGSSPVTLDVTLDAPANPQSASSAPPDKTPPGNWADSALRTSKFSAADARGTPAARGLAASLGPGRPKPARVAQSHALNNSPRNSVVGYSELIL